MTEETPSPSDRRVPASGQVLWLIRLAALVAAIGTLWLAFEPPGDGPGLMPWDKAGHALAFYVLTVLFTLALPRVSRISIALVLVLAGGAIELVQDQVGRDMELMDWVADVVGIALALVPAWLEGLRRWMGAAATEDDSTDQGQAV